MNDTRSKFEEIWPVPDGVVWSECGYGYEPAPANMADDVCYEIANEWDYRLDTFTRCQETPAIHLSLIDELVQSLQWYVDEDEINECDEMNSYWISGKHAAEELIGRAKQKLEQIK